MENCKQVAIVENQAENANKTHQAEGPRLAEPLPTAKIIAALSLAAGLWACNPAEDMISPPGDCPDTTWVMTRDSIRVDIHHRPCVRTIEIADPTVREAQGT